MLLVVLGTTFHSDARDAAPPQVAPKHQPRRTSASTRSHGDAALLAAARQEGAVPAAQTRPCSSASSYPDTLYGDKPVRALLDRRGKHKAVRLVFRTGGNEYWGIEETDWDDAPVLARPELPARPRRPRVRPLLLGLAPAHGRAAARTARRYWVVNTLLDSLSNETMLAIAKGLKPLTAGK